MDAILETSPHYHSTAEKTAVCTGGAGGSHSSASMHLNVGLSESYHYISQSDHAKCVRSNPIPGKLQAQHS